jgi:CBS domain-containing protein
LTNTAESRRTMKVHNIMSQPPWTCRLETSLGLASKRMAETACGTLLVLDHHGRVAGILTDRDLALAIGKSDRNPFHMTVDEAMTRDVHTCSPNEDLSAVLERMAIAKVRRLPVVTADGDLKGIVSIDDIILWGVQHGGVTRKELVRALRAICSVHETARETEFVDTSDTP